VGRGEVWKCRARKKFPGAIFFRLMAPAWGYMFVEDCTTFHPVEKARVSVWAMFSRKLGVDLGNRQRHDLFGRPRSCCKNDDGRPEN